MYVGPVTVSPSSQAAILISQVLEFSIPFRLTQKQLDAIEIHNRVGFGEKNGENHFLFVTPTVGRWTELMVPNSRLCLLGSPCVYG
jgi:hypothetical protein